MAGGGVTTLLVRYTSPENFPMSAYLVIGLTLMLAFVMVGLVAADLSFTLKNQLMEQAES